MELKRKLRKVAASALALTMSLSFGLSAVGCNAFQGQLQVEEFVANSAQMDTEYYVGETINFDGLVLKAKYNDNNTQDITVSQVTVKFNGKDVTNSLSEITATTGEKTIELIFEGKTVTIKITVSEVPGSGDSSDNGNQGGNEGNGGEEGDGGDVIETPKYNVASYTLPEVVTARTRKINNAGQAHGSANYESTFYEATDKEVVVGDDNVYKFLPYLHTAASFVGDDVVEGQLITAFKTNTTISIYQNDEYVALDKQEGETQISYSLGGVVYATETVGKNEYDFSQEAVGQKFKLAVLPEDCYVDPDEQTPLATPVTVEVKVVDAFNVYTAKQLAIIENVDTSWDSIKTEMGITAEMVANVKGIVLQNDIALTASDIPSSYTYTLDKEIKYTDSTNPDNPITKTAQEWGLSNTFIHETGETTYYGMLERKVLADQTFDVYGNYYMLDYSKMPLVSSLKVEDGNGFADGYGENYSNATLLRFIGESTSKGNVTVSDLDSKGNANRSQLLDEKDRPVYAGGMIFMKMEYINLQMDNVINKTSFIAFIPELSCNITMNHVKCFDSYQSATFMWGDGVLNVTNSTMERSGGPLFILQHVVREIDYIPKATVDAASILNNPVTGQEAWFASVGATEKIGQMKALSQLFMMNGKALLDGGAEGKLNLLAIVMPEANDADALTDPTAQGYFAYGDYVIDRMADSQSLIRQVYNMELMHGVPVTLLQAGSAIFNTTNYAIGFMPNETSFVFVDELEGNVGQMRSVFYAGEYVTMTQLGLSVMLKFYPYGA